MKQNPEMNTVPSRRSLPQAAMRIILAGLLAFLVLEVFCRFYFNKPIHHATPGGPTDYVWEPNVFYSCWTEGIGYGKTNNEGYYNLTDYIDNIPVDVLIMGSSFMQAEQVPQSKSTASVLSEYLPSYRIYNIGTAAHRLLQCFQNLPAACERYHPQFVVLETQVLNFSSGELQMVLDRSFPEEASNESPLLLMLKRSTFLNLLYYQFSYYRDEHGSLLGIPDFKPLFSINTIHTDEASNAENDIEGKAINSNDMGHEENYTLLRQVLLMVHDEAAAVGATVIIVYHPKTWMDGYGGILVYDTSDSSRFKQLCEECGIVLLNMSDVYRTEYEEHYTLPYGFINTAIGNGHLNTEGHKMIARELANVISGMCE